jgi:hypothetical protein
MKKVKPTKFAVVTAMEIIDIFRSFRKIAKSNYKTLSYVFVSLFLSVRLSLRPSAWNNSAPTGRNSMKYDIWIFFNNRSRKFKFH